jgi:hypothetical protein
MLGAWMIIVGLAYAFLVPQALAPLNFAFIAAVLLMLVIVAALKSRGAAAVTSMGQVLYDTEHPASKK